MVSVKKNNTKKGKTSNSSKPFFSKSGRSKNMSKSKPETKPNKKTRTETENKKKTNPEKENKKKESQVAAPKKTMENSSPAADNNTKATTATNNNNKVATPSPQPLKIASRNPIIKKAPTAKNTDEPANAEPEAGQEKTEVKKAKPGPDPKLIALKKTVNKTSTSQGVHPVAENVAGNAQKSAPAPANEKLGKAQEEQVKMMDAQEASEFDAKSFKKALLNSIAAVMPKDEEDAEKFSKDDRLEDVKKETEEGVATEKENAAGPIEQATGQEPDVGKVADRQIDQLTPVPSGPKPNAIKTKGAAPPPRPASEVSAPLKEESKELDKEMEELGVSDETLANSNEPTFVAAGEAKKGAKTNAEEAPDQFRKEEDKKRVSTQKKAKGNVQGGMTGLFGMRKNLFAAVGVNQKSTMSEDELARKKVSTDIDGIFLKTKKKVDDLLAELDTEVAGKFDFGAKMAKIRFEIFVAKKMKAYKKERYGDSWISWKQLRRVKDHFKGLPKEVDVFYVQGKEKFLEDMDVVLTAIANIVAKKLKKAKEEIATGKKEVQTYVEKLPADLQKVGKDAATAVESKFDSLDEAVDSKKDELIQSITNKYKENVEAIDARIEEMKLANSGLINQALQLLAGPLLFIRDMWNTLTGLLATIIEVVGSIISNPIGFASMLFSGISQGFTNFGTNILTHLQTGFIGWLTGALGPIGITIPEDVFSLKGIFDLVTQVLGLTKDFIREKAVKLLGEETVEAMEKGFELFQIMKKEGIMGLWKHLEQEFSDLKETVMGAIKEMLITQVVMAGIKWIMGLLNPAAAFVKAILLIVDVIKFFIERGSQIVELVQAFIEGVKAVASGSVGAVAKAIEMALAKAIPVLIGFLASLLGLGGISSKVTKIIRKIKKRIDKAIDKIILKAKKAFGKLFGKKGKGKKKKKKKKKDDGKGKLKDKEVGEEVNFKAGGESHKIWINTKGSKVEVMVSSVTMSVVGRLTKWKKTMKTLSDKDKKTPKMKKAGQLIIDAQKLYDITKGKAITADKEIDEAKKTASDKEIEQAMKADNAVEKAEGLLKVKMQALFEIFGDEDGVMKKFEKNLAKLDPDVKLTFYDVIEKNSKALKGHATWDKLVEDVKNRGSLKNLYAQPMSANHEFGRKLQNIQAVKAFTEAVKDRKEEKKTELLGKKAELIKNRVREIHGGSTDEAAAAKARILVQITDKTKTVDTTAALLTYYARSLKGGASKEHDDYKVTNTHIEYNGTKDGELIIKYSYLIEKKDQKPEKKSFTVTMMQETLDDGAKVTIQTVEGLNLAVKDPGRGKTKSAVNENARPVIEEAQNTGSKNLGRIKGLDDDDDNQAQIDSRKESSYYKEQEDLNTIQFNASHLIADWFMGSGYSAGLNLVTTSEFYNKKVMGNAERGIKTAISLLEKDYQKEKDVEYITFDMIVEAKWMAISDKNVADKITKETKAAAKEPAEQKEIRLKALHKELASDVDPKFCKSVEYDLYQVHKKNKEGKTIESVGAEIGDKIKQDTHMKEILKKQ